MWNKILRAILFVTVFSLLFLMLSPLFVPKNNSHSYGIHEPAAKGFLAEPENSLDVLFLGDSETFSAFIPIQIWEDHGITSYLCSTADQVMYQSAAYLDRFFRTQSPKVVILETNALYRDFTLADMASYELQERLPYLRYHDRWKDLTLEDLTGEVNFTHLELDKGYVYRTASVEPDLTGYMAHSDEVAPISFLNRAYAREILEGCREKGAQLIFVSTPSPVNWNYYNHNGVTLLAQELGVPYIDMNLMQEEVPIDWTTDSYDGGDHLNFKGAIKVTDYMGQYFQDMGLFADKREDPAYKLWNDIAEYLATTRER